LRPFGLKRASLAEPFMNFHLNGCAAAKVPAASTALPNGPIMGPFFAVAA
jgi:hypothetical protein